MPDRDDPPTGVRSLDQRELQWPACPTPGSVDLDGVVGGSCVRRRIPARAGVDVGVVDSRCRDPAIRTSSRPGCGTATSLRCSNTSNPPWPVVTTALIRSGISLIGRVQHRWPTASSYGGAMPSVSPEFAAALRGAGTTRPLRRGERLVHEGGRPGAVLFVISGTLRIEVTTPEGDLVVLAVRGPGDLVGDLGPLGGRSAGASVVARESGEVVLIPSSRFVELVRGDTERTTEVLERLVGILYETENRRVRWLTRPVQERVVAELLSLCGDRVSGVELKVSHAELAGLCGSSRSAVSQVVGELADRGLLTARRGRLLIDDVAELAGDLEPPG